MDTNILGLQQARATLGQLLARTSDMRSALLEVAQMQVGSFTENFRVGGRPAWKVSKRVAKHGGKTLVLSSRLMKSIRNPEVSGTSITYGSNLPYAAIHQFGGDIKRQPNTLLFRTQKSGRSVFMSRKHAANRKAGSIKYRRTGPYTIHIDPRPYIVFQERDIESSGKIVLGHLLQ